MMLPILQVEELSDARARAARDGRGRCGEDRVNQASDGVVDGIFLVVAGPGQRTREQT